VLDGKQVYKCQNDLKYHIWAASQWKPRIYSTRGDGNPGSTAPETMETQDLQHQRRWKPRIYSTIGDGNPGSTTPEASSLTITPLMWFC
jgi:hypothetical protein